MKALRGFLLFLVLLVLIFPGLVLSGCSRPSVPAGGPEASATQEHPAPEIVVSESPAWPVSAIVKAGANPLWFEFLENGPRHIASPAEASLVDYAPWPLARFCSGLLVSGQNLVMAINRTGFLVAAPGSDQSSVILYLAEDFANWDPYSIASVFLYGERPAVLLYRDDFFAAPADSAPEHQVLILREDLPRPAGIRIPALGFSPQDGWETNALRQGPDGFWYYRLSQPGESRPGIAHYRTRDLSLSGERISQGEYRNSSRPETDLNKFPLISRLIAELTSAAIQENKSGIPVLQMISPDFSGPRLFSASSNIGEDSELFFGYYRNESAPVSGSVIFAVSANGRGIGIKNDVSFSFALPALPAGFVYTGIGLVGNTLIASWEEQEEFAIGAAGIMVIEHLAP
jgi:hypothetical protein